MLYFERRESVLDKLIEWENRSGYKAKYIAKKLGLSEPQYSKLKRGKIKPTIEVAYLLHQEFKVDDAITLLRKEKN